MIMKIFADSWTDYDPFCSSWATYNDLSQDTSPNWWFRIRETSPSPKIGGLGSGNPPPKCLDHPGKCTQILWIKAHVKWRMTKPMSFLELGAINTIKPLKKCRVILPRLRLKQNPKNINIITFFTRDHFSKEFSNPKHQCPPGRYVWNYSPLASPPAFQVTPKGPAPSKEVRGLVSWSATFNKDDINMYIF